MQASRNLDRVRRKGICSKCEKSVQYSSNGGIKQGILLSVSSHTVWP